MPAGEPRLDEKPTPTSRPGLLRLGWVAWLLVLLAVVVRLGYVAATPDYLPVHDDHDYDRLACAIVGGHGYPRVGPATPEDGCGPMPASAAPTGRSGGTLSDRTAFRPPGYPAFLAGVYAVAEPLTDRRWTAARVAQALLGALAAALIGLVAGLIWGRPLGLLALGLAAVYLPLVTLGGSLVSETLFVTLELGAVAAVLWRPRARHPRRWLVAAGVLAGLATLTRTNGPFLLIPLMAAVWWQTPRLSARALAAPMGLLAVAAVTIAPWTVRNALAMDALIPVNAEAGSAVIGTYNDSARNDERRPGAWRLPRHVPEARALLDARLSEPARQRRLLGAGLRYMAEHPLYVLEVAGRNTLRLAGLTGREWWRFSGRTVGMTARAADASAYCFFAFAVLALAGALSGAARRAPAWFWVVPLLLLAGAVVIVGETRFRAPVDPFVVILTALGVARVADRLRGRRSAASPPSPPERRPGGAT